jgi:hypothetical protein
MIATAIAATGSGTAMGVSTGVMPAVVDRPRVHIARKSSA